MIVVARFPENEMLQIYIVFNRNPFLLEDQKDKLLEDLIVKAYYINLNNSQRFITGYSRFTKGQ